MAKFQRKIKCPEGVPEWILTYGDMMSLLLCFFIMLYAISTIDVPKVKRAVESLNTTFGYLGSAATPNPRTTASTVTRVSKTGRARQNRTISGGQPIVAPPGDKPQILSIRPELENVRGGFILFLPNSDVLRDEAKAQLQQVSGIIKDSPYRINLEGYASLRETQSIYHHQYYLAYARAVAVRDFLIKQGIAEKYFIINAINDAMPRAAEAAAAPLREGSVQISQMLNFPVITADDNK